MRQLQVSRTQQKAPPSRVGRGTLLLFLAFAASSILLSRRTFAGLWFTQVPLASGADTRALIATGSALWAGTLRGVWRTTGDTWSIEGLGERTIASLAVTEEDAAVLWALAASESSRPAEIFRREAEGNWDRVELPPGFVPAVLASARGAEICVGGTGVICSMEGAGWRFLPSPPVPVTALHFEAGMLLAAHSDGSVVWLDGTSWTPLGQKLDAPAKALAFHDGAFWAGGAGGAYQLKGSSWEKDPALGIQNVLSLVSWGGALRAGTLDSGAFMLTGTGWAADSAGIISPSVTAFAVSRWSLYAGTAGGPVYRLGAAGWAETGTGIQGQIITGSALESVALPHSLLALYGGFSSAGGGVLPLAGFSRLGLEGCGDIRAISPLPVGGTRGTLALTNCGLVESSALEVSRVLEAPPSAGGISSLVRAEDSWGEGPYLGTTGGRVFHYDKGGFVALGGPVPNAPLRHISSSPAGLFVAMSPGLWEFSTGGEWRDASQGLPPAPTVRGTAGSPARVWAILEPAGVYRRDPPRNWTPDSAGARAVRLESIVESASGTYLGGPGALLKRVDGGWIREETGLPLAADVRSLSIARSGSLNDEGYVERIYAGTAGRGLFSAALEPSVLTLPVVADGDGASGRPYMTALTIGSSGESTGLALVQDGWQWSGPVPALSELRIPDVTRLSSPDGDGPRPGRSISILRRTSPVTLPHGRLADVYAMARVYAEAPSGGTFGVTLDIPSDIDAAESEGMVFGLVENSGADRSNLAVVHLPGRASGTIALEVRVFAADGTPAPNVLTQTLSPGQWFQWNRVLAVAGLPPGSSGYAHIFRVSGIGPWWAYGVINNEATSDGSVLPVYRSGGVAAVRKQIVPIVLDARGASGSHYTTELTLANDSPLPSTVGLVYRASAGFGPEERCPPVSLSLAAREQRIIPDILAFLRERGLRIPDSISGPQAGTLTVWFRDLEGIDEGNTVVLARTTTPNPDRSIGGRFGVSYPAHAWGAGARSNALVPALAQDSASRSNLAVVHTGGGSEIPLTLSVQLRDARTGIDTGSPLSVVLRPGEWYQWTRVIEQAGAATDQATAVITRVAGDDTFLAYGIVNDALTSDGSYIKMIQRNTD
ncbi:MAG: hypothetical protein L6R30_03910 [Thermoanaerobaculia bacterium]|nr:hypothetical protein [Thermoanaerobaculia bacterium]